MTASETKHVHPLPFTIIWTLLWPVRVYLTRFPIHRGKGLLIRWLIRPLLPTGTASYAADLPGGGKVELRYQEGIGLSTMIYGTFEAAETTFLARRARPGTTAVDAGANVGLFTIPLAQAVGPTGRVLAFEPSPETVERLRQNVALNGLENVVIYNAALGESRGRLWLQMHSDPAYNALLPADWEQNDGAIQVDVLRLDDAWIDAGQPSVSVVKVDVEGSEASVLSGAEALLEACRPTILVEAATADAQSTVREWLEGRGFEHMRAPSLKPWNLVFTARMNSGQDL